jgi:hypothetical protein
MTNSFKLSLPTDIPWEKVCVTEDMMDRVVCDLDLPPKWQSSVAVFKYVPEKEYQLFPNYKITYLKVTATITGYQPLDDEIQGEIDWDGVNVETIDGLTEILNSYYPCTGAILQVVVGPPGRNPNVQFDKYPFFLDFEPKKRELYEIASDTKEKQSRSIETLNISKSAGTTQSLEVMDIDMGGGGFGISGGQSDGIEGGFSVQGSSGQWGTKRINTDQSQVDRATESGTEKRESYSHTTQLSQMYHLLDSYHLGTNRAVFFIQPRPHVIEEPTGFVRGPRKVEGIQEFFMVVAQPKDQKEFCLSVRLDTSHLVETDILEYDYRTDTSELATANPPVPTKNDTYYGDTKGRACFIACWDVTYKCYYTRAVDDKVYSAPDGYIIESYTDLVNESSYGGTWVSIAPGNKTLTIHAEAESYRCFEDSGVCLDCDDKTDALIGSARRQVQVNLRSEEPIIKVGTQQQLVITTRGLCCCPEGGPTLGGITGWADIPDHLGGRFYFDPDLVGARWREKFKALPKSRYLAASVRGAVSMKGPEVAGKNKDSTSSNGQADQQGASDGYFERRISIRQANAMTDFIREQMVKSFREPRPGCEPKRFVETDLFHRQLESHIRRSRVGYSSIRRKAKRFVPEKVLASVSKHLGIPPDEVKVSDVLRIRSPQYLRLIKMKTQDIYRMKMELLGVKLKEQKPKLNKETQRSIKR